jgi:hypothetical protein
LATHAKTVLFALLSLTGCKGTNDSDHVAGAFVDAYYVEFDHARAKALAAGGALRRIEEEEKLVREARAQMQVEDRKARVYYSDPAKRQVSDELAHYTYQLDVRQANGAQSAQTVVVMLARRDGVWKVIEFREGQP